MKILYSIFLLLLLENSSLPQATYEKHYGDSGMEAGLQIINTFDGNYLITGFTTSIPGGNILWSSAGYLLKITPSGDTIWSKKFITGGSSWFNSLCNTSDSCYILCGFRNHFPDGRNVWLIKVNASGDLIWEKTYAGYSDGSLADSGEHIQLLSDGGFILTGGTTVADSLGKMDIFILKLDENGDSLWSRSFDGGNKLDDTGRRIFELPNGEFFVAANINTQMSGLTNISDIMFLHLDQNGDTICTRKYDLATTDCILNMKPTSDGNFIVSGNVSLDDISPSNNIWLLKVNTCGDTLWTKHWGWSGSYESSMDVTETNQHDGYLIAAYTQHLGQKAFDNIWFMRCDQLGDTLWTKLFEPTIDNDDIYSVIPAADGGYIACGGWGHVSSLPLPDPPGIGDVYVLKFDENCAVGINEFSHYPEYSENIFIYPNPAQDEITLIMQTKTNSENTIVEIYSFEGKFIRRIKYNFIKTLDVSDLSQGIYFIRISANNKIINKKIEIIR
jgi:hypothetical protein